MKAKPLPPLEAIRTLICYDPETGRMSWNIRNEDYVPEGASKRYKSTIGFFNKLFAGKDAFIRILPNGYYTGTFLDKRYLAHRIAFYHYYGFEPECVDHINGNKRDNRIANLRATTKKINSTNRKLSKANKSGFTGVFKEGDFWVAMMKKDGVMKRLGSFIEKTDAIKARAEACEKFGYIDRYGEY